MNHTGFPKEDHIPDSARRDNQVKKGDRVDHGKAKSDMTLNDIANEYLLAEI